MNYDDAMREVLAFFGTKASLARALNVTRQSVQDWEYKKKIPSGCAIQIEKLSGGALKAIDLI